MIYIKIFSVFLKIGAISFGGGYAMIPLIKDEVTLHNWLSEDELLNFIAISESTPGPLAVNMATFIGSKTAGFPGALLATLGVITPAFIIILLIAALLNKFLKYKGVKFTLDSLKPTIIALILGAATTLFLSNIIGFKNIDTKFSFDYKMPILFLIIGAIYLLYKKLRHKNLSPILLILISAILGVIFYGLIP